MRSRVLLSGCTLYLRGSQVSVSCSDPESWPMTPNSSHAAYGMKYDFIYFFLEKRQMLLCLVAIKGSQYSTNLKQVASPGGESLFLPIQLISLSCGSHTFGTQLRELIIHSMGKSTKLSVHARAKAKNTVPRWLKKEISQTILHFLVVILSRSNYY